MSRTPRSSPKRSGKGRTRGGRPPRTLVPAPVLASSPDKPERGSTARATASGVGPRPFHWVSPDLGPVDRGETLGRALVARRPIVAGSLVLMMGGHIMTIGQHDRLPEPLRHYPTHVSDGLLIGRVSLSEPDEPGEFLNHSCDPNCGMQDQLSVVARRNIRTGEVVTIDYAMCMTSTILDLACECRAPGCRGRITGDDWKDRALQERYKGQFVGYIQRKIEAAMSRRGHGRTL
jgi:hypothetical protein